MEATNRDDARPSSSSASMQFLSFTLGASEYGVSILKVREILQVDAITRVPSTPGHIRGVINVRGRVVPVVDLARKFGMAETAITKWACILIVEVAPDGTSMAMGVLADAVREVIEVRVDEISPPPEFGPGIHVDYLTGMARVGKELVLLVDLDRLISEADVTAMDALTDGDGSRTTSSAAV